MNDKIRDIRDKLVHDELFVCVTRCKDCKNYVKDTCYLFQGLTVPAPNDYCSYAERRESE